MGCIRRVPSYLHHPPVHQTYGKGQRNFPRYRDSKLDSITHRVVLQSMERHTSFPKKIPPPRELHLDIRPHNETTNPNPRHPLRLPHRIFVSVTPFPLKFLPRLTSPASSASSTKPGSPPSKRPPSTTPAPVSAASPTASAPSPTP
jgi:hypothetical protein